MHLLFIAIRSKSNMRNDGSRVLLETRVQILLDPVEVHSRPSFVRDLAFRPIMLSRPHTFLLNSWARKLCYFAHY